MKNARFSDADIDAVRSQADLVAVVSQHVALRRSGSSMKGLCPFHDERTPSFTVNPSTSTWVCYGCNEYGDVIDFIQKIEGEGFRWSVEALAEQFNVRLSYEQSDNFQEERSARTRLIEVNEAAAAYFADQLLNDADAQTARDELARRDFDVRTAVERFGCGYAPRATAAALVAHLTSKGHSVDDIVAAGVATKSDRGPVRDRFRGRLVWTIRNPSARAIGFGARRLYDDDPLDAKFINTTETPVYKKSQVLYGYDYARKEIAKTKRAVVVEGYTDVMACHLAEVNNAVAACGTAFTAEHLAVLRRLVGETGEIVFAMDDDNAGRKASIKVYDLARDSVRRLSALPASDGLDPDEVRQQKGDEALHRLVEDRQPLIKTVLRNTIESMPLDTPEDRRNALDAALPLLAHVTDPLMRGDYGRMVAKRLDYDPIEVAKRIKTPAPATPDTPQPATPTDKGATERDLLSLIAQKDEAGWLFIYQITDLLTHPKAKAVVQVLREALDSDREGRTWTSHVIAKAEAAGLRDLVIPLTTTPLPATVVDEDSIFDHGQELLDRMKKAASQRTQAGLRDAINQAGTSEEKAAALQRLLAARQDDPRE